jgi:hypothetical protein
VTATTQEEVLSGILPRVNINKITLTNPSENILNISLDLLVKETLDDGFFGSWFEDININKYIVIDVVQSTDSTVTNALSYSNDMIQLCNLRRSIRTSDTRLKALAYITKNNKVSTLLDLLDNKTTRKTLSINRRNTKITDQTSFTNNDGDKIYEVSYKVDFSITDQPEHLAYFVVCSIDLDKLCSELKIDYDVAEALEENGRVISEIVINESAVVSQSYVYTDKNGVIWSGPVHQNQQGLWRSGDDETTDSIDLERVAITNTKVQDFRRFNRIEKLILDFNDDKAYSLLSQKQSDNITKIQSVDYKPNKYLPEFTEIFTSNDANGNTKFLFGVNFINALKNYSKFSRLLETNNDTFKEETIRETKILDLKIFRRRIKNPTKKPYEKLNPEESDEVILQTKDISWKNLVDISNTNAAIKEVDIFTNNTNNYIRYFTGTDKSFKTLSDGVYQYYIELEIEDGINDFIRQKLQELETAKQILVQYSNKISKPTMKKFIAENINPHIDSPSEYSQNSLVTDYGYDIVSNKLSPQLISKTISEYGGIISLSAPWNACSTVFSYILDIFSSEIQTDEQRAEISKSLYDMLNPNSTNPQIVLRTISMFEYFIATISKTFDITISNTNFTDPVSSLSSRSNKSFKITKVFEGFSDTAIIKSFGIDYLSNTISQPPGEDGLLTITSNYMLTRATNEMSKFFTTQNPNISFSNVADNIDTIKYSYLTPTRIDFPNKKTVFSRLPDSQINANIKSIEYFFQDNDSMLKATSLHADIINFKMDVSGKNRFLTESRIQQNAKQKRVAKARKEANEKQTIVSNKMKEVLADYSSATFQRFSITENNVVEGTKNETSFINLVSSLSADTLRNKQMAGYKRSNTANGFVPNYVEEDYIKNLSSLSSDKIRIQNNIVTGFKTVFPAVFLTQIPNQLRAVIFKPQELQEDIRNIVTNVDNSYKTNVKNKAISYFHFEMIGNVEYLEGFVTTTDSGEQIITAPVWRQLNKQFVDGLEREKEILCRIRSFNSPLVGIKANQEVEDRTYDKYFILKTAPSVLNIVSIETSILNSNILVNNFIDLVRNNLPGVQIKQNINTGRSLFVTTPSIQIIKTEQTGKKEIIEAKDIRNMITKDISVSQSIKVGTSTIPASVKSAVNVLSIAYQGANISNGVRSSNFVPNINVKKVGGKI